MPNLKFSQLTPVTTLDGTEYTPVIQSTLNKSATIGNILGDTTGIVGRIKYKAGEASALTAPIKLASGTLNTTAEAGAIEFLADAYYGTITTGSARKTFAFLESPIFTGTVGGITASMVGAEPADADLTAIAALGFASTSFLKKTALNTWALDTKSYLESSALGTVNQVLHGNPSGTLTFSEVVEADIILTAGNTVNNTKVGTHGFAPALSGVDTQFLRGDGAWAAPGAVTVPNAYAEESFAYSANTPHTITHNFGARPLVQCITSGGDQVIPLTIHHTSTDVVAITFDESATFDVILTLGSPPLTAYTSSSGNYNMLDGDTLIEITAANKLVTLLTPVGRLGKQVTVKNSSGGICDVITAAGLIEGVADVTIPSTNAYTFASNGVNWIAI